jgi:hypothetical protein
MSICQGHASHKGRAAVFCSVRQVFKSLGQTGILLFLDEFLIFAFQSLQSSQSCEHSCLVSCTAISSVLQGLIPVVLEADWFKQWLQLLLGPWHTGHDASLEK